MGFHAHALVVDDPLDPTAARAMSEKDLAAANYWMNETLPSRKVNKAVTPTLLIMQRLHQNDPSGNRLESAKPGEVRHISLPADTTGEIKPSELIEYYQDGLFDPIRLRREVLLEQKGLSEYAYAGQYLQSPVPPGGGMFKVDRIEIIDAPPAGISDMVRYWDKAGTPGGGDFTVGAKMGVSIEPGNRLPCYYIIDVVRGQWDSAAREALIRQTAELDGKEVKIGLEQEPGSAGKESAENTTRRLAGFRVKIDRVTGPKEVRADTFSSQVNAHNVKVVRAPWTKALLDELRFFPMGTNDDQVDACSGAFSMLTKPRLRVGAF
jgi:predicted phage terminase large subunit-like protein